MKRIALTIATAFVFLLPVSVSLGQFDGHATSHSSHSNIDWD